MFRIYNKISTKINLIVFLIIIIFMLINGIYSYYDYKNTEKVKINNDLNALLKRLPITASDFIWNFNIKGLKEIIIAEMSYKHLIGIVVKDYNKILLSIIKDKNKNYDIIELVDMDEINKFLDTNIQKKSSVILYEDKQIGQVFVVITDHFINSELYLIMLKTIIQSLVLAIFTIVLISLSINNIVEKPIKNIVKAANDIANGDMEIEELEVRSKDELGTLITSFNKMLHSLKYKMSIIEKIAEGTGDFTVEVELASDKDVLGKTIIKMLRSLNEILGQVNITIDQVSSGSNQVAQASSTLSQGATVQASSLEQITSSITEISSQAKQNADNARQANSLSKNTIKSADKGNQQMKDLIAAMYAINKSADMIRKITKVIDDLAFQTNLLSLNANVEAARAGKYGKGFAVVAEEVRNLAGRSAESARETTQIVEDAIKNIITGNNLVDTTAKQLEEIMHGANKVAALVEEIALASKEQTLGLEQINQGLEQIDLVTQGNTATAEESAAAAKTFTNQVHQLKNVIANFKLAENQIIKESNLMIPEQIKAEIDIAKNVNY